MEAEAVGVERLDLAIIRPSLGGEQDARAKYAVGARVETDEFVGEFVGDGSNIIRREFAAFEFKWQGRGGIDIKYRESEGIAAIFLAVVGFDEHRGADVIPAVELNRRGGYAFFGGWD